MATNAGEMTTSAFANPQWVLCNGAYYHGYAPLPAPPRPHTVLPSTGTRRDYQRRVGGWSGTRGIGGWLFRVPRDPGATWYISTADDSVETTLVTPPTAMKPPAGVR